MSVSVPAPDGIRAAYKKVTTRAAEDWPALGVAAAMTGEGAHITAAKIVVSAATEIPTRLYGAESILSGTAISEDVLKRAGDAAVGEANLITDPQGSAAYKRELLKVTVCRVVRAALEGEVN